MNYMKELSMLYLTMTHMRNDNTDKEAIDTLQELIKIDQKYGDLMKMSSVWKKMISAISNIKWKQESENYMKKYQVIEDNAGCLTLVVFSDLGCVEYIHTGYEYNFEQLAEDLKALKAGENPAECWDENLLDDDNITDQMECPYNIDNWFAACQEGQAWNIVCDNDEIYWDKMGITGKKAFDAVEAW